MKASTTHLLTLVSFFTSLLNAQTPLVGTGSAYANIFEPSPSSLTYNVPGSGGVLLSVNTSGFDTLSTGVWDLKATGGANLLGIESAAQIAFVSSEMRFRLSDSVLTLAPALALGASLHYNWEAQAYFDTSGVLNYQPNTLYNISFNVNGSGGLLGSVLGVTPSFSFELIDGSGARLSSVGSGSLINIAGLLGTGVPNGTISLDYLVDGTVPTGPIGVRFTGDALLGATALNVGQDFATISGLNITATPVPEPGGAVLLGAVGVLVLLRRKRSLSPRLKAQS